MEKTSLIVKKVIRDAIENPNLSIDEINEQDDLVRIGVDSLAFIKIIIALEKEFNIKIDDIYLDVGKFATVGQLVTFISDQVARNQDQAKD